MNSKLHAKFLTMAAATLGLSLMGTGCGKSEPAAEEGAEAASGAEHSCGSGSCGSAGPAEEGVEPGVGAEGDMAAPAGEMGAPEGEMGAPEGEMPAEGEPAAPAGEAEGM